MVGDLLRVERERQKLSVKDIEHGTSIRAVYIEAIENGNYDKLPGNVYTKGFIKNYGNFLKLDGEALVRQFVDEVAPPPPIVPTADGQSAPSTAESVISEPVSTVNNKKMEEPEIKIKHNTGGSNGSGLLVAAVILIAAIAGGLWYYFTNIEGKEIAQNMPSPMQSQQVSSSNATPAASASTPDSAQSSNLSELNLQAKFNDRCWTKVVVDGRIAYEGTAEAGQTLTWKATDRIIVTAGNAGAVEFIENGSNLGIAGGIGDVVEKTFIRR